MIYTIITVPGKRLNKVEASAAEIAVKEEMCWYNDGTLFVVIDENNKVEYFRKVKSDNAITGYVDLIKEDSI